MNDKNIAAEMAIIGALLCEPKKAVTKLIKEIKPEMFSDFFLSESYAESLSMFADNGAVDAIRLMTRDVDGYDEGDRKVSIAGCYESFMGIHNLPVHIKAVQSCYKVRELVKLCSPAIYGSDPETVDEQLEGIGARVGELLRNDGNKGLKRLGDVMTAQYIRLFDKRDLHNRIKTGFEKFDKIIKGAAKKNLVIIAARPAVGKSAMALSIANYNAKLGKKVALFSLEMGIDEISERLIANTVPVNLGILQDRDFGDHTGANISKACGSLKELPFYFDDSGYQTVPSIRTAVQLHKVDVVVIDYLQLIASTGRSNTRNDEVSKITRDLKRMAQDLDVPVIVLSQLNRSKDETDEPSLRDLRDSGAIEQDANMVWFMWLNGEQKDESVKQVVFRAAKNRQGMTGEVVLNYRGALMQFEETNLSVNRNVRKGAKMPWEEMPDAGVF